MGGAVLGGEVPPEGGVALGLASTSCRGDWAETGGVETGALGGGGAGGGTGAGPLDPLEDLDMADMAEAVEFCLDKLGFHGDTASRGGEGSSRS